MLFQEDVKYVEAIHRAKSQVVINLYLRDHQIRIKVLFIISKSKLFLLRDCNFEGTQVRRGESSMDVREERARQSTIKLAFFQWDKRNWIDGRHPIFLDYSDGDISEALTPYPVPAYSNRLDKSAD